MPFARNQSVVTYSTDKSILNIALDVCLKLWGTVLVAAEVATFFVEWAVNYDISLPAILSSNSIYHWILRNMAFRS